MQEKVAKNAKQSCKKLEKIAKIICKKWKTFPFFLQIPSLFSTYSLFFFSKIFQIQIYVNLSS